jgi:hypothetical protein
MKVNFLKKKKQLRNHKMGRRKQLLKQPTNHACPSVLGTHLQWANMQAEPADSLLKPKRLY